ncbi:MAG: class A beta-lactamase-related serine hydrolase [Flavipsychrobacter sp.]|nr:class A beta-lactamase-related serine hydrolase [Flavipsychrobacter sp.]
MFKLRLPSYYLVIATLITAVVVCYATHKITKDLTLKSATASYIPTTQDCKVDRRRLSGYTFVSPLLYVDRECESPELVPLKESVINAINRAKNEGLVSSASVYVRSLNKPLWTAVDAENKYHPASLAKVPVLITYMRMVEGNNQVLNQKIAFAKQDTALPHEHYTSKNIQPGNSYTVKDLLHYMIAYSDNNATLLLMQHMNIDVYNKLFTDLGLAVPSNDYNQFQLSVKEYSLFLRVLYNATYLSVPASEYALELLAECDFKEGMLKLLPSTVKVAHKFGESGYGTTYELHESGIVYAGVTPYLITIMTTGSDLSKQATVISNISAQVYNAMTGSAL